MNLTDNKPRKKKYADLDFSKFHYSKILEKESKKEEEPKKEEQPKQQEPPKQQEQPKQEAQPNTQGWYFGNDGIPPIINFENVTSESPPQGTVNTGRKSENFIEAKPTVTDKRTVVEDGEMKQVDVTTTTPQPKLDSEDYSSELDSEGKVIIPEKRIDNSIPNKVNTVIQNTLSKAGVDLKSGMGEVLTSVLTPIFTGVATIKRGQEEQAKGNYKEAVWDTVLGGVSATLGLLPPVAGVNAIAPAVTQFSGDIAEGLAMDRETGVKIGHAISMLPFGLKVTSAMLSSETAVEFLTTVLEDKDIDELTKERIIETASHIGFFGGLGVANKLFPTEVPTAPKQKPKTENPFDVKVPEETKDTQTQRNLLSVFKTDLAKLEQELMNPDLPVSERLSLHNQYTTLKQKIGEIEGNISKSIEGERGQPQQEPQAPKLERRESQEQRIDIRQKKKQEKLLRQQQEPLQQQIETQKQEKQLSEQPKEVNTEPTTKPISADPVGEIAFKKEKERIDAEFEKKLNKEKINEITDEKLLNSQSESVRSRVEDINAQIREHNLQFDKSKIEQQRQEQGQQKNEQEKQLLQQQLETVNKKIEQLNTSKGKNKEKRIAKLTEQKNIIEESLNKYNDKKVEQGIQSPEQKREAVIEEKPVETGSPEKVGTDRVLQETKPAEKNLETVKIGDVVKTDKGFEVFEGTKDDKPSYAFFKSKKSADKYSTLLQKESEIKQEPTEHKYEVGQRVKTPSSPQVYTVEEKLPFNPKTDLEGEVYYKVRTKDGKSETILQDDLKPVKEKQEVNPIQSKIDRIDKQINKLKKTGLKGAVEKDMSNIAIRKLQTKKEQLLEQLKEKEPKSEVKEVPEKNEYEEAKKTVKKTLKKDSGISFGGLSKLNDITDPQVLKSIYTIGKYHLTDPKGVTRTFGNWANKVVKDIGKWAIKGLKNIYDELIKDRTGLKDVVTQGVFPNKNKNKNEQTRETKTNAKIQNYRKDVISDRRRPLKQKIASEQLAKEKIKDPNQNESLKTANEYVRKAGLGQEIPKHEYRKNDADLQTNIANLYPKIQDPTSKNYKETKLEKAIYESYKEKYPDVIKENKITDYQDLVKKAYERLIKETQDQYDAVKKKIKISFHEGDKQYLSSSEMLDDVHNRKHLWVFRGGEDHSLLGSKTRDSEGLTANDKFRAVHDYFGHSIEGYMFGKRGEENAWIEHSKMFSPLAQWALTSETRGQNSFVNFSGKNKAVLEDLALGSAIKKKGIELNKPKIINEGQKIIDEANKKFQFAEQKSIVLPEVFTNALQYLKEQVSKGINVLTKDRTGLKDVVSQGLFSKKPIPEKPISTMEIGDKILDRLGRVKGVDVRGGKLIKRIHKRALGLYHKPSGLISIKNMSDFRTLMHELGHGFDHETLHLSKLMENTFDRKIFNLVNLAKGIRNIEKKTKRLDGLKQKYGADVVDAIIKRGEYLKELLNLKEETGFYSKKPVELIANFIEKYVTKNELATRVAPKYTKFFESILNQSDKLKSVIEQAKNEFDNYDKQDVTAKLRSQIVEKKRDSWVNRAIDDLTKIFEMDIEREFRSGLYGIKKLVKKSEKSIGELNTSDNPFYTLKRLSGVMGIAKEYLQNGIGEAKGLWKDMAELNKKGSLLDYRDYLVARRGIELSERGLEKFHDISKSQFESKVKQLEEKYGDDIVNFAEKFWKFNEELRKWYFENSGNAMSAEKLQKIADLNKNYVKFNDALHEVMYGSKSGTTPTDTSRKGMHKIGESKHPIYDPFDTLFDDVKNILSSALVNKANKELINVLSHIQNENIKSGDITGETIIRKLNDTEIRKRLVIDKESPEGVKEAWSIEKSKPKADNIISVLNNDKYEYYEIPKPIHQALFSEGEKISPLLSVLRFPATLLRAGVVEADPTFAVRNVFSDQLTAMFNAKYGYIPFWDLAKGVYNMVGKTDAYRKYRESGADFSFLTALDMNATFGQRGGFKGELTNRMKRYKNLLVLLQDINRVTETGTRVGVFKKALQKTGDVNKAMLEAKEVTGDYSTSGRVIGRLAPYYAFLNPRFQHAFLFKDVVTGKRGSIPKKLLMGGAFITLPSILNWININSNPEAKEVYDSFSDIRKKLFFNINIPFTNQFLTLPKRTYGILFGTSAEMILDNVFGTRSPQEVSSNENQILNFAKSFFQETSPISNLGGFFPTGLTPIVEQTFNESFFTGNPIVPQSLEDDPKEYQFTDKTPYIFRHLGKKLKISPLRTEHLFRSYLGGLGGIVTGATDEIASLLGIYKRPDDDTFNVLGFNLRNLPIGKGIIAPESKGTSTSQVTAMYDKLDRMEELNNALIKHIDHKDDDAVKKIFDKEANKKDLIFYEENKYAIQKFKELMRMYKLLKEKSIEQGNKQKTDFLTDKLEQTATRFHKAYNEGKKFEIEKDVYNIILEGNDIKKVGDEYNKNVFEELLKEAQTEFPEDEKPKTPEEKNKAIIKSLKSQTTKIFKESNPEKLRFHETKINYILGQNQLSEKEKIELIKELEYIENKKKDPKAERKSKLKSPFEIGDDKKIESPFKIKK